MTAAAPWDVHAYHDAGLTFPHHPTADQLYTDQKFEAYRALGELAGSNACGLMKDAGRQGLAAPPPKPPDLGSDSEGRVMHFVRRRSSRWSGYATEAS
jgi:hypothetical protein